MKIEKSIQNDHQTLSEITYQGKAYWGYTKQQLEEWKEALTITQEYIENNKTFKLILDDKIIGYYSLLLLENQIVELDNLFLLPEFIGKGHGKLLMNHCTETAISMNAKKIVLDSEPNAEVFYKKMGFTVYGKLKTSIANRFLPQMELILEK